MKISDFRYTTSLTPTSFVFGYDPQAQVGEQLLYIPVDEIEGNGNGNGDGEGGTYLPETQQGTNFVLLFENGIT